MTSLAPAPAAPAGPGSALRASRRTAAPACTETEAAAFTLADRLSVAVTLFVLSAVSVASACRHGIAMVARRLVVDEVAGAPIHDS